MRFASLLLLPLSRKAICLWNLPCGQTPHPSVRGPPRGARTLARSPLDRLRHICLALPNAWEKVSHGEPTFWVGKKMFATFANAANHHGAGRHAVWCKATHVTDRKSVV